MASEKSYKFVFTASCPASRGIVAAVTTFLSDRGCYLSELSQFDDPITSHFFMRAVGRIESGSHTLNDLCQEFQEIADLFQMEWSLVPVEKPCKVLLMVSKFDHCLADLLYRLQKGEINMDVTAIVSNHLDLRPMAEREGIRFIYLPVTKENKAEQEKALMAVVEETGTELVVLARYMQILSNELCEKLKGKAINIHHSFLPGFKGAKPYHQAHTRGVKLIGSTAHYVTSDLDEGPIIEQSVQVVDHSFSPDDLVAVGRNTETVALAKAVKLHTQSRVFNFGNKTIVFR